MDKYLYLTRPEWIDPWVNAGVVPISLASSYLGDERGGTRTLDENRIHKSEFPIDGYANHGLRIENCKDITVTNFVGNGRRLPDVNHADYYKEDGLILSFCNSASEEIGRRLKKRACVKILNIEKLKRKLDKQLGCKGAMGECEYTADHQRNHFLKSVEDSWQDEYRIFWRTSRHLKVTIPKGFAEFVMGIDET